MGIAMERPRSRAWRDWKRSVLQWRHDVAVAIAGAAAFVFYRLLTGKPVRLGTLIPIVGAAAGGLVVYAAVMGIFYLAAAPKRVRDDRIQALEAELATRPPATSAKPNHSRKDRAIAKWVTDEWEELLEAGAPLAQRSAGWAWVDEPPAEEVSELLEQVRSWQQKVHLELAHHPAHQQRFMAAALDPAWSFASINAQRQCLADMIQEMADEFDYTTGQFGKLR